MGFLINGTECDKIIGTQVLRTTTANSNTDTHGDYLKITPYSALRNSLQIVCTLPATSVCQEHEESKDVQELVKMAKEIFSQKNISVQDVVNEFSPLLCSNGFAIAKALSIVAYENIGTSKNLHLVRTCFASLKAMNLLLNPDCFTMINLKLDSLKFCNQHADFIVDVENNLMAFLQSMTVEKSIHWKVICDDASLLKKVTSCQTHSQAENTLSAYEKTLLEICHLQKSYLAGDDMMDNSIAKPLPTKMSMGRSIGRNTRQ